MIYYFFENSHYPSSFILFLCSFIITVKKSRSYFFLSCITPKRILQIVYSSMKLCHFLPQLFSLFSSKLTLKNDIFCPVPIFLHDFLSIYFQLFDKHPHFLLYSQRIFANFFSNNIHHFTTFLDDLTTTFSSNKSQCISLSIF